MSGFHQDTYSFLEQYCSKLLTTLLCIGQQYLIMRIEEIKRELGFSQISFFSILKKDGERTSWNRATNPITGDFLIAHEEVIDALVEDKSISTLYLKRVEDTIFSDGILHRTFILCISSKEAVASF